jgi:2-haloacid dehalogenase
VLRDGIALAAAGSYASFSELAPDVDLSGLRLHGDVVSGLSALRERGHRVVPFTNGSAEQARSWLEAGGALGQVDEVLDVSEARRWKPAPEAYRWALGRCGAAAGDAVLVAVHPWDIHGAQRVGIRGAWLNRDDAAYPAPFGTPDLQARHLPALAELI